MGYVAVATIVGSGLLNAWLLVRSFANLITTPYGQLLIVKVCLFGGMLALAALNRFWLVPSLIRDNKLRGPAVGLSKLHGHVLGEQALGLLIILIVSAIGTREPALNSSQQERQALPPDRFLGCCRPGCHNRQTKPAAVSPAIRVPLPSTSKKMPRQRGCRGKTLVRWCSVG